MPYRFLEDVATADAAFEAWGATLEETFRAAAEAELGVMVEDLASVLPEERRTLRLEAETAELLLFEFLQELVYRKDAEQLLLRVEQLRVEPVAGGWTLTAEAAGAPIDPARHQLLVDVKAVTLHRFRLAPAPGGWRATVILDV